MFNTMLPFTNFDSTMLCTVATMLPFTMFPYIMLRLALCNSLYQICVFMCNKIKGVRETQTTVFPKDRFAVHLWSSKIIKKKLWSKILLFLLLRFIKIDPKTLPSNYMVCKKNFLSFFCPQLEKVMEHFFYCY